MFYEPAKNDHGLPNNPFPSLIVPRPIGWITTLSKDGKVNLAPFSLFNGVGYTPPTVVVCPNGRGAGGGQKDTVVNIRDTGEFVANMATWELREQVSKTAATVPPDVNEMELAGLTPAPSRMVKPPRVAESPVALECKHIQTVELPSYDPALPLNAIFGVVVGVHIKDEVITDGRVDIAKIRPIARLGYMDYTVVDTIFEMAIPELEALTAPDLRGRPGG